MCNHIKAFVQPKQTKQIIKNSALLGFELVVILYCDTVKL